jgi:hypothetical protein
MTGGGGMQTKWREDRGNIQWRRSEDDCEEMCSCVRGILCHSHLILVDILHRAQIRHYWSVLMATWCPSREWSFLVLELREEKIGMVILLLEKPSHARSWILSLLVIRILSLLAVIAFSAL